jgi:hypothetical protein
MIMEEVKVNIAMTMINPVVVKNYYAVAEL